MNETKLVKFLNEYDNAGIVNTVEPSHGCNLKTQLTHGFSAFAMTVIMYE